MSTRKEPDLTPKTLVEKRAEWLTALVGEDRNSIRNQVKVMTWHAAAFRVVNEGRRLAPRINANRASTPASTSPRIHDHWLMIIITIVPTTKKMVLLIASRKTAFTNGSSGFSSGGPGASVMNVYPPRSSAKSKIR
jgi:hypothetical protein